MFCALIVDVVFCQVKNQKKVREANLSLKFRIKIVN